MKVYLICPLRNKSAVKEMENIRRADKYAIQLFRIGLDVFNPLAMYQSWRGKIGEEEIMKSDLNWLSVCDCCFACSGWHRSKGCCVEVELANRLNIPVFLDLKTIKRWAKWRS